VSVVSTGSSQTGAGSSYVQVETSSPVSLGVVIFVQTATAFSNKSTSSYISYAVLKAVTCSGLLSQSGYSIYVV
jgi:hypothetical protein